MSHELAAVLLAPLIPLVCLALLLWLDHLEVTLEKQPTKALPEPVNAAPTAHQDASAGAHEAADLPAPALNAAVAD